MPVYMLGAYLGKTDEEEYPCYSLENLLLLHDFHVGPQGYRLAPSQKKQIAAIITSLVQVAHTGIGRTDSMLNHMRCINEFIQTVKEQLGE